MTTTTIIAHEIDIAINTAEASLPFPLVLDVDDGLLVNCAPAAFGCKVGIGPPMGVILTSAQLTKVSCCPLPTPQPV